AGGSGAGALVRAGVGDAGCVVVDRGPVAAVPVGGDLVDALESVGGEAGAVGLLPHHVLAELPVGGGELVAAVEEHAHAAEAPHRAGRVGGVLGPALRP